MIPQSNCSESCHRLTGDLEDIKEAVVKMIDIVIKEDNPTGIKIPGPMHRTTKRSNRNKL